MATSTYTTHGITVEVQDNSEQVLKALRNATIRGLEACGAKAESYAKEELSKPKMHADGTCRDAVDTGKLRNNIAHKTVVISATKQDEYIGTNIEYAPFVEFGTGKYTTGKSNAKKIPWTYKDEKGVWHTTSGQMPHPFLKPAATEHTSEYRGILENSLKNA